MKFLFFTRLLSDFLLFYFFSIQLVLKKFFVELQIYLYYDTRIKLFFTRVQRF